MHLCTMIQVKLHKLIGVGHLQVLILTGGTLDKNVRKRHLCMYMRRFLQLISISLGNVILCKTRTFLEERHADDINSRAQSPCKVCK